MSETVKTYTVPRISNQTVANNEAAVHLLDTSLGSIEDALNDLSGQLATSNARNAIIRHNVPVGEGVSAGMLVYYNSDPYHACFEPAIAELEPLPGNQGQSIESPKARVEGLIVYVDNSNSTGTLLCGGYYESNDIARICLGDNATAGTYYLSPVTAGMATKETNGLLRQPVLSYYGYGKFSLSLFYLAHDNHFHTTAILSNKEGTMWRSATAGAPTGAAWEYSDGTPVEDPVTFTYPTVLDGRFVGELAPEITAVFYNGVLQQTCNPADTTVPFVIANGKLYYRETPAPASGSVVIFNHFPFAYNSAVIRSIQSANENMLSVVNANGMVTLKPYDFISGASAPSASAVSSIVEGVVSYTPVVPGINAGPGATVARALDGVTTVSLKTLVGSLIDAHSIQNNGSTVITDGVLQFFNFPAGRTSELVMFLPVTDVPEGMVLQAKAWATLYGPTTQLAVNGYFIAQPTADTNTTLPDTTDLTNTVTLSFANGANGELSYAEIALNDCLVSQPGMLVARIRPSANPPSSNIQLLRLGFKLDVYTAPSVSATTPTDQSGMVTQELTSAEAIRAGSAVYVNSDGLLAICRARDLSNAGLCVGVAMTSSSSAGTPVTYVISGVTQAPAGVSLIPGTPVYIAADGSLQSLVTQGDVETFYRSAEFLQRVGTAVSNNMVQVHIEPAVIRGE